MAYREGAGGWSPLVRGGEEAPVGAKISAKILFQHFRRIIGEFVRNVTLK